jgi:hypothetical protein
MGQFAASIHAGVESLRTPALVIAAVALQETVAAVGERHCSVTAVQHHGFHQALMAKMAEVGIARVGLRIMTLEIAFDHDPKRADGRERTAVVAVQFVPVIAIEHDLAIDTARQFEAIDKWVTRIESSWVVPIAITNVVCVGLVVLVFDGAVQFDPVQLDVAVVIVPIMITWIEVHSVLVASCANGG